MRLTVQTTMWLFHTKAKNSKLRYVATFILKMTPGSRLGLYSASLPLQSLNERADRFGCFYWDRRWTEAEQENRGWGAMTASKEPSKKKPKEAQQDEVHTQNKERHIYFLFNQLWEDLSARIRWKPAVWMDSSLRKSRCVSLVLMLL